MQPAPVTDAEPTPTPTPVRLIPPESPRRCRSGFSIRSGGGGPFDVVGSASVDPSVVFTCRRRSMSRSFLTSATASGPLRRKPIRGVGMRPIGPVPLDRPNGHVHLCLLQIYDRRPLRRRRRRRLPIPRSTCDRQLKLPPRDPFCGPYSRTCHPSREGSAPDLHRRHGDRNFRVVLHGPPLRGVPSSCLEYKVPRDFDWGSASVKQLQLDLVKKYEQIHFQTNRFLDAQGRAAHYGFIAFEGTLNSSKGTIRDIREAILKLMVAIYQLGKNPLPPNTEVDRDVASILNEPLMATAARDEAAIPPERISVLSGIEDISPEARDRAPRFLDNAESSRAARDSRPPVTTRCNSSGSLEKVESSYGAEGRLYGRTPICSTSREPLRAESSSTLRGSTARRNIVGVGYDGSSHGEDMPAARSSATVSREAPQSRVSRGLDTIVSRPADVPRRVAPRRIRLRLRTNSIVRSVQSARTIGRRGRLITKGAAARARAEAAWDARAREESRH